MCLMWVSIWNINWSPMAAQYMNGFHHKGIFRSECVSNPSCTPYSIMQKENQDLLFLSLLVHIRLSL